MPITDLLERNSKLYGKEIALVEINPELKEEQRVTWKEYELIQPTSNTFYRRQITWGVFDEKANRVANMLIDRGIMPGQKCAILLMNCLEWLPIYFGILKAGAIAVPLNFRFTADEIEYCLDASDSDVLFYGPEFIGRIEDIESKIKKNTLLYYVGDQTPTYAEHYFRQAANFPSRAPKILIQDTDAEGDPAQARSPLPVRENGGDPSRHNQERHIPVHSAAVPYRRQDALVRLPLHRQPRCHPERQLTGSDHERRLQ